MEFSEKEVRKISIFVLSALLLLLAFLVVRPFLISIVGGLILAYIFMPLYRKINNVVKNKSLAASLVSGIIIVGIAAILWFSAPILIKQAFNLLLTIQKLDLQTLIARVFPTASPELVSQLAITLNSAVGKGLSSVTAYLSDFITNLPVLLLDLFIIGFIFFFTLRDSEKFASFMKSISPLNEAKEKVVVKHFKDMTSAVIYGWVIVGIIQGTLAGIGFYIFGIHNALVLTVVAIFFSIIPFLGPMFIWVPVGIYLVITGSSTTTLVGYFLYNVLIVSLVDNILRSYIVSKRTNIHSAVVLIGMIGGLFVMGVVGLVVGPLLLAYLLTLLESFRDKSIYALFN